MLVLLFHLSKNFVTSFHRRDLSLIDIAKLHRRQPGCYNCMDNFSNNRDNLCNFMGIFCYWLDIFTLFIVDSQHFMNSP